MDNTKNWMYLDYRNNLWKFSLNGENRLFYKIMYSEGKWTKETTVDNGVLSFSIYIDMNEDIHVVYSISSGELKYCTMKDNEWFGKVIYKNEKNNYKIKNINLKMIGNEMNIFYVLESNDGSDHAILMHCIWIGSKIKFINIQDIIMPINMETYYEVEINNYKIDLLFLTDEGDEVSLNHMTFENYIWSSPKRLYGIQGEEIEFSFLTNREDFHILNKVKEKNIYSLDYVYIDSTGEIIASKVREDKTSLEEILLFLEDNKLVSCWIENNEILYSLYNGEEWSNAENFNRNNEFKLYDIFYYFRSDYIKSGKVYGNDDLDLILFNPREEFGKNNKVIEGFNNIELKEDNSVKEIINNLKFEISRLNSENKKLNNKISHLNKQIENSQMIIKSYDERINRLIQKKTRDESKYDELLAKQIQEKETISQKLSEEKRKNENIDKKITGLELKNKIIEEQIKVFEKDRDDLNEENFALKKEIESIRETKYGLEDKINKLKYENDKLKIDLIKSSENNKEILNINNNLKDLSVENIKLKNQNENYIKENIKLKNQNENYNKEIIRLNKEKENYSEENRNVIEVKKKLNKEIEVLLKENNELREQKILDLNDRNLLKEEKEKLLRDKMILIGEKEQIIEEKIILIEENLELKDENEKLKEELELEKNQSVMDRLLRRRIN